MAKFATPAGTSPDLGGPLGDFKDKLVALQAQGGIITVGTKYGPSAALRVQVLDATTGKDEGIRLLFWKSLQAQLTAVHAAGDDWLVGVISESPQKEDPTKTFYSITDAPEGTDYALIELGIDKFEAAAHNASHPGKSDDAPF
jgi:hypothetical protein